jgi:acyl carrier protein
MMGRMTRDELQEKVIEMMAELFELPAAQMKPETRLFEDLALDSIDAVDLVVKVQELTGRRVDVTDLRRVRTVADVVDIAVKHVGADSSGGVSGSSAA